MATTLIYRREGKGKRPTPAEGNPENIQVGDAISYWDPQSAFSAGRVEKINTLAGVLRLAAVMYGTALLRPPRRLTFADIIKAERPILEGTPNDAPTSPQEPPTALVEPEEVDVPAPLPVEPPTGKKRDSRLPASGVTMERDYKGRAIQVLVGETSFEFEGRTYKSLSKIAQEITGQSVNGFLFFKLNV